MQPDCLLVELPADMEGICVHIAATAANKPAAALTPPVAALIYNPKDTRQAIYLPMADFSPEWVVASFASQNEIPLRCMDLPCRVSFAQRTKQPSEWPLPLDTTPDTPDIQRDPMAYLAHLAGHTDSERWWEVTFESADNAPAIFDTILELMTALRAELPNTESETLLREAFMRQCIRKAVKDGFRNIAVVCGAWHAPALRVFEDIKAANDNALLRGLGKVKTVATWIPWSYERLTFDSGYSAGITSPVWYELLLHHRQEAATRWMVAVAGRLREEDLSTSSAHVIEAVRLANTLAGMRGLPLPGLEELRAAAVSTICEGDDEKMALVEQKLIRGSKMGFVPNQLKLLRVPLLGDVEQAVKSARLLKYWEQPGEVWLGATQAKPFGGIDLREPAGRLKSILLHRLQLLSIPWGHRTDLDRHQSAGSFLEYWKLNWEPDMIIRIIEAGTWGNTLEVACTHFLKKQLGEIDELPKLTALVGLVLNAGITAVLNPLLRKIDSVAALTTDVFNLMEALPPLVRLLRYGNARDTELEAVNKVVRHMTPRICVGLPGAVYRLDGEASRGVFKNLLELHHAIDLLPTGEFLPDWLHTLERLVHSGRTHALLAGACTRLLFDKKHFDERQTEKHMHLSLSASVPPLEAAAWLEGFLQGSAVLLLHYPPLWRLLDGWVSTVSVTYFPGVLPLLRRVFSQYSPVERRRLFALAQNQTVHQALSESELESGTHADKVMPLLRLLLGENT